MSTLFNLEQAAGYLSVSRRTIQRLISQGDLPAYHVGDTRVVRIKQEDLDGIMTPLEAAT
jgi:excisionase family DNA binding protein